MSNKVDHDQENCGNEHEHNRDFYPKASTQKNNFGLFGKKFECCNHPQYEQVSTVLLKHELVNQ